MKLNLLVSTAQLNSLRGRSFGTGTMDAISHLAGIMATCGIKGDIYDLPCGSRNPATASPFSLNSGFALNTDDLNLFAIPELHQLPELENYLRETNKLYKNNFKLNRSVSYTFKRSITDPVLKNCAHVFFGGAAKRRIESFQQFKQYASYWLDDFALFEVMKENKISFKEKIYIQKKSFKTQEFITINKQRINYHIYSQFLCYEQRLHLRADLQQKGIGLIVNLPFAVELFSPDVYFHPEVFDDQLQVGCAPEPEHGYPEQAWGVAAYREKTEGLKLYLKQRMGWISRFGDGIFIDHLVGWCGQYVVPMNNNPASPATQGKFLSENPRERQENISWFLEIIIQSGLKIRGEIAGDGQRLTIAKNEVERLIKQDVPISAMVIPRWEFQNGKLKPLQSYDKSTLMMVETHDTSTLLQYLLNSKQGKTDIESKRQISEFCLRVLGLPALIKDIPFELENMTDDFCFEIIRRLTMGTPAADVVFSLPALLSFLCKAYRNDSIQNNINVQPGTSGEVGNPGLNWSFFSAPIEIMEENKQLNSQLKTLGNREFKPFDYFHQLDLPKETHTKPEIWFSKPKERSIWYKNQNKTWIKWSGSKDINPQNLLLELIVHNNQKHELWDFIHLNNQLDLDAAQEFYFMDLNQKKTIYTYQADYLKDKGLFIKLAALQTHHFLVYY